MLNYLVAALTFQLIGSLRLPLEVTNRGTSVKMPRLRTTSNIAIVDFKSMTDKMELTRRPRNRDANCSVSPDKFSSDPCAAMTAGNLAKAGQQTVLVGILTHLGAHEVINSAQYPFYESTLPKNFQLVYFTNAPFKQSIYYNTSDSKVDAVKREVMSWRYLTRGCLPSSFKWFFQVDDDSIINFQRLALYVQSFENKVGNPAENSRIFGRNASWYRGPVEIFGGTGLLATQKLMENMGKHISDGAWSSALCDARKKSFGDHLISKLITSSPLKDHLQTMQGPFGLSEPEFKLDQNLVVHLKDVCHTPPNCAQMFPSSKTCFVLHKAITADDVRFAEGFFNASSPTIAEYEAMWH